MTMKNSFIIHKKNTLFLTKTTFRVLNGMKLVK